MEDPDPSTSDSGASSNSPGEFSEDSGYLSEELAHPAKIPRLSGTEVYDHKKLLSAIELNDFNMVLDVLSRNPKLAQPVRSFSLQKSPMVIASKKGNLEIVKLLRMHTPEVPISYSCVQRAVKYGHLHLVEYFLNEGFSITHENLVDDCVRFSQTAILQLLLARGAKLDRVPEGSDPLLLAPAWLGDYEMCKLLVDTRVDLRAVSRTEENTPLLQAVARGASGNSAIVDLFLEHGADVNYANRLGYTAFDLADENCFTSIGLRLFESGARVSEFESGEAIFISRPYLSSRGPVIPNATGCVVCTDGVWMCGRVPGVLARFASEDLDEDDEADDNNHNNNNELLHADNENAAGRSQQTFDLWRLEKDVTMHYFGTPLVLEGDSQHRPETAFGNLGNHLQTDPSNPLIVEKVAKSMVASLMRTAKPIELNSRTAGPLSYFEIEILNGGAVSAIAIGVVPHDYETTRLPGWEVVSFAYHGDNGYRFASAEIPDSQGSPYGPPAKVGDVMGCGVLHSTREVFFTHNGRFLGVAGVLPANAIATALLSQNSSNASTSDAANVAQLNLNTPNLVHLPHASESNHFSRKAKDFHFAVGLRSVGEKITANFGHKPFRFNFEVESLQWHRGYLAPNLAKKIRRLQNTSAIWLTRGHSSLQIRENRSAALPSNGGAGPVVSVVLNSSNGSAQSAKDPPLCLLSSTGLILFDTKASHAEWRDYAGGNPTSEENPLFKIVQLDEKRVVGFAVDSGYNLVYVLDLSELRWSFFAAGGTSPVFGEARGPEDFMDTLSVVNGKIHMLWLYSTTDGDGARRNGPAPVYLYVLDVDSKTWEKHPLPKMISRFHMEGTALVTPPSSRQQQGSSAAVAPSGKAVSRVVYFGGWDRHHHSNAVQIFDQAAMRWQRIHTYGYATLKPRSQVNICSLDHNRVIVVGGWDGMQPAADVDLIEFKPVSSLKHGLHRAFDCDDNLSDLTVEIVGGNTNSTKSTLKSSTNSSNSLTRVRVHKVVLCSRSAFFRKKLLQEQQEEHTNNVSRPHHDVLVWEGPSARAGRLLLEFLYSDVMECPMDDAPDVLYWAKSLFPEHLTRITEFVIMTRIGVNSSFHSDLQWALNDRRFADISFDVMGKQLRFHKVILTTLSDYFRALLRGHFKESHFDTISRPDVEPVVFEMLVQFLYTNRLEVCGDWALQLLALANQYNLLTVLLAKVHDLRDRIEDSLVASVTLENCCFLLGAADLESCTRLRKVCLDFAGRHFSNRVAMQKAIGFADLSESLQKELLTLFI